VFNPASITLEFRELKERQERGNLPPVEIPRLEQLTQIVRGKPFFNQTTCPVCRREFELSFKTRTLEYNLTDYQIEPLGIIIECPNCKYAEEING
jgi:hypothetical protein